MESWLKNNILTLVLGAGTLLEAISALELILNPSTGTGTPDPFVGLILGVFNWLIPLAPFLLLSLLYFPLAKLGILWGSRHSKSIKRLTDEIASLRRIGKNASQNTRLERLSLLGHPRLILIVSMVVAALLAYFPYRPDVNPRQIPVGIDTSQYISSIDHMLHEPFSEAATYALSLAWGGSRPFFLFVVYFVAKPANLSADVAIRFLPAFLAPLLVCSSYYFVLIGERSKEYASITAVLTAMSPVVTVGIWAGYLANWLAMIETFALLVTLFSHLRSPSTSKLAISIGLSLALVLTHPWTWLFVTAVTTIFLFSRRGEIPFRVSLKLGGSILSAYLIAELLKSGLLVSHRVVAPGELIAKQVANPFSNVTAFFPNVVNGLVMTYDGLLANSVLLVLALVSVIALRYADRFERSILCWIALTALSFPFSGDLLQSRLVYNLPLAIMAASGLLRIILNAPFKSLDRNLILLLVILFNANYALLAMASLPLL